MKLQSIPTGERTGQHRGSMLPWLGVLFLGSAALGAWFLIHPLLSNGPYYRVGWNRTTYEYANQILLLFVPWALALFAWKRGARAPIWLLLGGAVALHLIVLLAPPPQSQDFYQYLFYGRMQAAHGANPYVANPIKFWADPWFPWIRWKTSRSIYGPPWILLTFVAAKVAGKDLALGYAVLKMAVLALDVAIMAAIAALAKDRPDAHRAAGFGLLAYAWNPLVLMTVPLAGSADTAVAAAFLLAILARRRGRSLMATILLTLAALVKVYAVIGVVLHVVLLARERSARRAAAHGAAAAGVAAVLYVPYWHGISTFRGLFSMLPAVNQSLAGSIQRVVFASVLHVAGVHRWVLGSEVVTRVVGGVLLLGAVVWAVRRCRDQDRLWQGALVVLTVYMLVTPWFLFWYLLAPLALAAALPRNRLTYPLLTFSATSLITLFLPWAPVLLSLQTILRYGPPVALFFLQRRPAVVTESAPSAPLIELPIAAGAAVRTVPAAK